MAGEAAIVAGRRSAARSRASASGSKSGDMVPPAPGAARPTAGATSQDILHRVFGFERFRPGQQEVIDRLLAGDSALAIFPTGAGKSLCYELPALLLDGLTVVISPLIALMKDQVDFLRQRDVPAARLDSSLDAAETRRVYDELSADRLRLLYISPERLGNERFLHMIERRRIALLAVDEAHCISEWGHNFRPDYLKMARLAQQFGAARVLALTATATPEVARDIARGFGIAAENIVHTGFYRPNLELRVTPCAGDARRALLLSRLQERPAGSTVVYVTLQRTAEEVAAFLDQRGFAARAYHAGMESDARSAVQDAFMASDRLIVVATIAFGMGVDKANIRYVYHYNLPKGLESYMQEVGRAGRDGAPAVCELLACADDVVTLENFTYGDTPTREAVAALLAEILDQAEAFDVSVYDLSGRHDVRPLVVETLLTYLELDGVIQATGPFYAGFKFQPRRSSREILGEFDPTRAAFLRSVLQHARKGRAWYSLDVEEVSRAVGEPRARIVKALSYLEEKGDFVVQVSGLRQGYRRLRRAVARGKLEAALAERFAKREAQDIERIRRVCAWAEHDGCLTKGLLEYFGETMGDCGHCSRCAGEGAQPLPLAPRTFPDQAQLARLHCLRQAGHAALAAPRQMARFLCGLSSPATTRAKLRGHPDFGMFNAAPFAEVLALAAGGMPSGS